MTEVGFTDGTQCQGTFCPGVAPPVDPYFAQGQECKIDVIDPPSFVYVTEHFVYGTTPPTAGAVPVVEDAHGVFPYHGVAPATFKVDIEAEVAGKQGFRADTWNIGVGVTNWVPFDCRVPETTTTTVAPSTTTSTSIPSTAPTTVCAEACPTTTVVTVPSQTPPNELPNTGSSLVEPLSGIGLTLCIIGAIAARAIKR